MKTVNLVGCSCSKTLFSYAPLKSSFSINQCGFQSNLWNMFDEPLNIPTEIIDKLNLSEFKKKMVQYELNKTALKDFEENPADFFVIDLMAISFPLYKVEYNGKTTYTQNKNIINTVLPALKFNSSIENLTYTEIPFDNFPSKKIEEGLSNFCDWLFRHYSPEKVVLYIPKLATQYMLTSDNTIYPYTKEEIKMFNVMDIIVRKTTDYLIKTLEDALVFEYSGKVLAYNKNNYNNPPAPFKYTNDDYLHQSRELYTVITGCNPEVLKHRVRKSHLDDFDEPYNQKIALDDFEDNTTVTPSSPKTVNLVGSICSYNLFNFEPLKASLKLNIWAENITLWTLFSPGLDISSNIINKLNISDEYQKIINYELNKTFIHNLENSHSDYFMLDLLSISFPLFKIYYKGRITYSQNITLCTKILPLLAQSLPEDDFEYSEMPQYRFPAEDVEEGLTLLGDWLLDNYFPEKIIVYSPKRATKYMYADDEYIFPYSQEDILSNELLDEIVSRCSNYLHSKLKHGVSFTYDEELLACSNEIIEDTIPNPLDYWKDEYICQSRALYNLLNNNESDSPSVTKKYLKTHLDDFDVYIADDNTLSDYFGQNTQTSFSIKKKDNVSSKKRIKTINILGCSCSQKLFNYEPLKSAFKIKKCGFQINPWACFQDSLNISDDIINLLNVSDFKKTMFKYEINKTWVNELENCATDYLMIDLMLLSFSLSKLTINGKSTYTHNKNIVQNVIPQLEKISELGTVSHTQIEFWDFPSQEIEDGLSVFCEWIKKLYPPENIIVYLPKRAKKYMLSSDEIIHQYTQDEQNTYTILDEIVKRCTAFVISKLGRIVFYESNDDLLAYNKKNAYQKPYPFKYSEDDYRHQAKNLYEILCEHDSEILEIKSLQNHLDDFDDAESKCEKINHINKDSNNDINVAKQSKEDSVNIDHYDDIFSDNEKGASINISHRSTIQRVIVIFLLIITLLIAMSSFFK